MKQLRREIWGRLCGAACLCASVACGSDDDGTASGESAAVIENYASIVYENYRDVTGQAQILETAVDAFVAAPSASTLNNARDAWKAAREPYGQSEAFRFYDGPIDNPDDGPEGLINAWPLDEVYVDYVADEPDSGIINETAMFPTLSKQVIAAQNEKDGEKNISTGYHAIEFLLWGQDQSPTGPGNRAFTDYVSGASGTAANQARRGQYLTAVTDLLVEDLNTVLDAWAEGEDNYRADFVKLAPTEALRRMLQGMGSLSGAELSGERMSVAMDNRDQEDEHSCFSDNTHRDLYANAVSIQNVYLGRYKDTDGPGIDQLVRAKDAALDTKLQGQLQASLDAIQAIPVPFDQALMNDAGRTKILTAITALQAETETIVDVATLLGVTINLE
jgi:putative iron-regulated protein